jgi:hypothetical protein
VFAACQRHVRLIVIAAVGATMTLPAGWLPTPAAGAEVIPVSAGESIQAAIDRADVGDVILVGPGVYRENLILRGEDLILRSSAGSAATVLDGGGVAPVLRVMNGETAATRIEGFTIRNGGKLREWPYPEGAILISGASPRIIDNLITGTTLCSGGAVTIWGGAPLIRRNIIRDNHVEGCYYPVGGGITVGGNATDDMPVIQDNLIEDNTQWNGGGIGLASAGRVRIENNVIRNNHAMEGGGLYLVNYNAAEIVGNLIVDNDVSMGSKQKPNDPLCIECAGGIAGSVPTGPLNWGAAAYVLNNTIARNEGPAIALWGMSVVIVGSVLTAPAGWPVLRCTGPHGWSLSDNIFWNGGSAPLYSSDAGPCGVQPGTSGVVEADPGFVDGTSVPGDFRLSDSSPGVDQGFTDYGAGWLPPVDLVGMPRIADGNGDGTAVIDMGAYELNRNGGDSRPPTGSVTINDDAAYTGSPSVTLSLPASDTSTGVTDVRISNRPETAGGLLTYGLSREWTSAPQPWSLAGSAYGGSLANGTRFVYAQFKDGAGNWSPIYADAIVLDTVAPTATAPTAQIRAGATVGSLVPARVRWSAIDASSGIAGYELEQSTDDSTWMPQPLSDKLATSVDRAMSPWHRYRFRVRAVDQVGRWSDRRTSPEFNVALHQESSTAISWSGAWSRYSVAGASGGAVRGSTQAGAKASFTASMRAVGWAAVRGPTRGKASVYVDGVLAGTVDLYASAVKPARIVFTRSWASTATHTVTVRVAGTSGRPRVEVDAFVLVR